MRSLSSLKDMADQGLIVRALLICVLLAALLFLVFRSDAASGIVKSCAGSTPQEKEQCYSDQFLAYSRQHGAPDAFAVLSQVQRIDPGTKGCHFIAHGIGHGAYERDPAAWQDDFRNISEGCDYGAMHGVLEYAIRDLPGGLTPQLLPTICGDTPRADCNHIIGHLTLIETGGNIPKALSYCDVLKEPAQYDFCSSGVFMEEETATNLINHGLADKSWLDWPARKDGLEKLCKEQKDSRDVIQCWKELAHVFVVTADNDPKKSLAMCAEGAPSDKAKEECMTHSIGILTASQGFTLASMRATCDAFSRYGNFDLCAAYTVSSFLSSLPEEPGTIVTFCGGLSSESAQHDCFAQTGVMMKYANRSAAERERICNAAPQEYRALCADGGNVDAKFSVEPISHPPLVQDL